MEKASMLTPKKKKVMKRTANCGIRSCQGVFQRRRKDRLTLAHAFSCVSESIAVHGSVMRITSPGVYSRTHHHHSV
jgi:hypothetical protein